MVEAIKWILLGLGIGVAVEYARHIASLKELLKLPDFHAQIQEAERKTKSLEGLVPSLQADIEAQLSKITQLEAELKAKPKSTELIVEPIPTGEAATLDLVTTLPAQFRAMLEAGGIKSPGQLAAKTEAEVLEIVHLQPWDMANPAEWIAEAKALGAAPSSTSTPAKSDDLSQLPQATKQQIAALQKSEFSTFSLIAAAQESQLLEAVEAMPWDIVHAEEWIAYAKANS